MWKCRYLFKYLHIYEPSIIFRINYLSLLSRQCESGCAWPNPLSCTVMQHKHAQWLISARDTKRYTLTQGHSGDWRWHSNFNIRSLSTTHRSQHGSSVNYWCWIMRIVDRINTPTYLKQYQRWQKESLPGTLILFPVIDSVSGDWRCVSQVFEWPGDKMPLRRVARTSDRELHI